MTILSNLHTHTTYCDGSNTPREMVDAALAKGFQTLGFSGHAYTAFDPLYCMTPLGMRAYKDEVRSLGDEYMGRIQIYLGIENDACDPQPCDGLDYVIGSSHYLPLHGIYHALDNTPEMMQACINAFGGALSMARAYYRQLSQYALQEQPDIIGHFDIITKFNANNRIFDADSPAYQRIAFEALDAVVESGAIVEVNTGGMARGFTTTPYPAPFLLKRLLELGAPIVVNSDAHAAGMLDAHFATMRTLLRDIGFRETMEFTPSGFIPAPLL